MRRVRTSAVVGAALLCAAAQAHAASPDTVSWRVSGQPIAGSFTAGHLWVLQLRAGSTELTEIDARSGRETGRRVVVESPSDAYLRDSGAGLASASLVRSGARLWAIDHATNTVVAVDPATATVVERVDIAGEPRYLAAGAGGVWVTDGRPRSPADGKGPLWRLVRIDPSSGAIVQEVFLGPGLESRGPVELAISGGAALTSWPSGGRFRRTFDLATAAVTSLGADGWEMATRGAAQVTTARTSCDVQITDASRSSTSRTLRMLTGARRCLPRAVALGPKQTVWAAYLLAGKPGRVVGRSLFDPRVRSYSVGRNVVELVADGGPDIWALSRRDRLVTRINVDLGAPRKASR